MSKKSEQQFLKGLDDILWKAADRLRNNLDAANYIYEYSLGQFALAEGKQGGNENGYQGH
jgi:type I restriction-modification system DNA methylase subunit